MNLAEVVKTIRLEAKKGANEGESRQEWQTRLVGFGMAQLKLGHLVVAGARQWLMDVARDATADVLKRPGTMPRVAAGQLAIWPKMEPVVGRQALRAYARKYRNVVPRYSLVVRLLGYLDVNFGADDAALAKYKSLETALRAAGATTEDLALLRELANNTKTA